MERWSYLTLSNRKITATSKGKSLMNDADGNWQTNSTPGKFCNIGSMRVAFGFKKRFIMKLALFF